MLKYLVIQGRSLTLAAKVSFSCEWRRLTPVCSESEGESISCKVEGGCSSSTARSSSQIMSTEICLLSVLPFSASFQAGLSLWFE